MKTNVPTSNRIG